MKISRLLKLVLGMSGFFNFGVVADGGGSADASPLGHHTAAEAFTSYLGGDGAGGDVDETPEAAAERLASEEAAAATGEGQGDEQDQEQQDQQQNGEQQQGADTVTIEVDGKSVQMTKAELAEAVKGQMRQQDYTQKTMATAEEKRAAQAAQQAAAAERANYAQQLNNIIIKVSGDLQEQSQQVDWQNLLDTDPQEYLRQDRIAKDRQAALQQAQQQLGAIQQQHQQEQAEQLKNYQSHQQQALLAKLPDWKDPAKAKAEAAQIQQYLTSQEFTPEELQGLGDHRLVVLSRKAMLYDGLMERAGKAVKKVAPLPAKVERPGITQQNKTDGRTTAMKQLSKTGSVRDAASAFEAFL